MRKIQIYWSEPIEVNELLNSDEAKDIGLYLITRVFNGKQTTVYLGKSIHSYKSRFRAHYLNNNWLSQYRGKVYVRLGRIISPNGLEWEKHKEIISDAEKILISTMSSKLVENVANTVNTNVHTDTVLINLGKRGEIPKVIKYYI